MRAFHSLLFYLIVFTSTVSCQVRNINPSGEISTKAYSDFTNFTSLDLANDFKAYVTFTDGPELIKIEANENLMDYITVDMDGNTLVIKFSGDWSIRGKATLNAYISSKQLRNFRASGDAYIYLENTLNAENARITLRGDSQLKGNVTVNNLYLNIRGDSVIELDGRADNVDAELRGDSTMEEGDFTASEAKIKLSGDSVAEMDITDKLWANLSGDSVLKYGGTPQIMRNRVTGDSEMISKN